MEGQGGEKELGLFLCRRRARSPARTGWFIFLPMIEHVKGELLCVCSIVRIIVYALERARKMCALLLLLVDECSSFCREFGVQVNVSAERDARWLCSLVGKWKYSFDEFIIECRRDYLSKSHNCIDF